MKIYVQNEKDATEKTASIMAEHHQYSAHRDYVNCDCGIQHYAHIITADSVEHVVAIIIPCNQCRIKFQ